MSTCTIYSSEKYRIVILQRQQLLVENVTKTMERGRRIGEITGYL